ncbi:outer membrane protein assembly factor BamB family protein [Actinokineospora sp. 24-640]
MGITLVAASAAGVPSVADSSHDRRGGIAQSWGQPNADKEGTRRVGGPINARTVGDLEVAWRVPIHLNTGWHGSYATTPVVANGVVYTQDLSSNVYAIDLRSGRQLWTKMYNSLTNGPNGVAVDQGRVYGATVDSAFALDARTGRELWRKKLTRPGADGVNEGIDMAPGVHRGTVYISTVPGNGTSFFKGNGVGVLFALDGRTGRTKWKFNTVPTDLWGNKEINSGGGLWYPPSFDERGDVYAAIANPGPFLGTEEFPWGSSRPGPNLYTNSVVKLDGRTGKLLWYNQVLPHDIYDWDLQNTPIIAKANGQKVVIGSGKTGYVYSFDRHSGELLWKTPVGRHNGHDDDNLIAMSGEMSRMPRMPFELYPGVLGGLPAPAAIDDTTIYAAVNNHPVTWQRQTPPPIIPPFFEGTGEMVALDLVTGKIKWSHHLPYSPFGGSTVVNDLVFTTTLDGGIHAINTKTGQSAWQGKLRGAGNAPVAIHGDTLLAASTWPQSANEKAEIVAYRLKR